MDTIEKILEKTRRKGESKKWKTYIFAFIGILLIIAGFFGGMWIIGVFDYIHDTKEITNLYEFYESNVGQDGLDTVYFIGSSIVGCAIYPPEINRQLKDRGTNINVYNLCLNGDIPIERTLEIQKIIDTRPSLVIFGITYRSIVDGISEARFIERIKLVSNYLSIREDSLYLFNDDEKNLLNSYFDYTYLKSFIDSASAYKHTVKNPEKEKTLEYVVDPYGDKFRKYISTLKNPTEIYRQSEDPTDNWRPVVTSEKTRYKEALI